MKLLMITGLGSAGDLASGKKGAFYNTLEEFSQYWERIDIISPRIKNHQSGVKNIFGNVYIHISPWPLILHPIFFIKKALEIYNEQKFNLMTVHDFPPFYNGLGAKLLEKFIKVPYVLEIFHVPGYPRAANLKESIYKVFFKLFIRFDAAKARAVRVMNQTQVPDFLIRAGVPKEKIIYIPAIYVDSDVFKPTNLPKEYDLIFVGRLEKNKGIELLLNTIKLLVHSDQFIVKCLIVGEGSLRKDLELRTKNYKLRTNIIFHGWAKDSQEIAELINRSKILVMPSYNEGGPRVVVEALACGVPVLATPVGIVPDLLKNGLGGEIIRWEVEDIAGKAKSLFNDPETYKNYSQTGLELAKKFERKEVIKNYYEVINRYAKS